MGLSDVDRGMLDKIIDGIVTNADESIALGRRATVKQQMMISNERDFILGIALGQIIASFSADYVEANHRVPDAEELKEATSVTMRRMKEIDDKIAASK